MLKAPRLESLSIKRSKLGPKPSVLLRLKLTLIFGALAISSAFVIDNASAQQNVSPEEFKAAFIFHLLDKVEWRNQSDFTNYRIAVVGSDPKLLEQLARSVRQKKVKNKTVTVESVSSVPQMRSYHLLFISSNNNIPLRRIANATTRTNTLLITENTKDKTSTMVNLLSHTDGTYTFEVNKANITFEYLKLNKDILLLGGTEMDVAELFRDTTGQLAGLKEELKQQADALEESKQLMLQYQNQYQSAVTESERIKVQMQKQARLLEEKNRLIEAKNVSIREKEGELLAIQTELLQASDSLISNQEILGEKLNTIATKEKEVTSLSELIAQNEAILRSQRVSISSQKNELDKQRENLAAQGSQIAKQQSWLIFGAVVLLVFSVFLMVIIYLNKERRKTNLELVEKNLALSQVQNELLIARDQAQAANEAKSSFLANMSHEIRTPMNAIIGMLHLTKQTMLNIKQADYVNKIDSAANSLLQIINDILDFSKVEAGELKMEETEFRLSKVLDDLANLTGLKIQQKGLEFIYDIAPDIPEKLLGDPLRLGQILVNLTNNSMKFTERGEVKVKVSLLQKHRREVEIEFQIIDTGIGMTKDVAARLFKPFSQADSSTTRKFGGTGLGLAICKRLVEQMDGTISVKSKPKQGSIFTFNASFGYSNSNNILDMVTDIAQLQNYRVLLVVKNSAARDSVKNILKSFRCQIATASNFESCVGAITSAEKLNRGFDNILFDYKIACNHAEELQRIREHCKSKVTLLLSNITHEEEVVIDKLNPDIMVNKPVTPSGMLDALMPLIDKSKRRKITHRLTRLDEREKISNLSESLLSANILIVEDNEINQEVAKEVLSQAVSNIDVASDGQQAVDMVMQKHYDCILMDIQMPIMDGYEAARQIRKKYDFEELPIIAMTANAMGGDKEKCLAAGMNDYVSKPIRIKSFFETLNKWFELSYDRSKTERMTSGSSASLEDMSAKRINVPIIDIESGTELMGDTTSFLGLLDQFRDQQSDFVKRANQLLKTDDLDKLAKEAHNLKGVSANLFIGFLPELASDLDYACRSNDKKQIISHLAKVDKKLTEVLIKIDNLNKEYA